MEPMADADPTNPYYVLQHSNRVELMQDVNRYLRTGKWTLAGGVATGQVLVNTNEERRLYFYQAITLK